MSNIFKGNNNRFSSLLEEPNYKVSELVEKKPNSFSEKKQNIPNGFSSRNYSNSFINPKIKVIVIIDACHSETILDLPYRYISGNKNVIENKNNKIKSYVILVSGCRDNQTSADAYNINNSMKYSGAMTSALLETLKKFNYKINCWNLLKEMRLFLKNRNFTQIPQICSTLQINDTTLFYTI